MAEQISPDGFYRWDGVRWVPRAGVIPTPVPAAPPASPGLGFAVAGAVAAFVGAVVVIVACLLPYATFTDSSSNPSPSIFNPGFQGGLWYAVEPIAVAVVGIVAGVLLIALRGSVARALAAGVLIALGVQTIALFVGYAGSSAMGPSERFGIGGAIGVVGGVAMAFAGTLAAVSLSLQGRGLGRGA